MHARGSSQKKLPGEVMYKPALQLATHELARQTREPEDPPVRDMEMCRGMAY